jgi:hypothetical protein
MVSLLHNFLQHKKYDETPEHPVDEQSLVQERANHIQRAREREVPREWRRQQHRTPRVKFSCPFSFSRRLCSGIERLTLEQSPEMVM